MFSSTAPNPPAEANLEPQLRPVLALLVIGFSAWLFYASTGAARRCAQVAQGWQLGGDQLVELTSMRADIDNVACASDAVLPGDLRCAHALGGDKRVVDDDNQLLRPYNTVQGELFLASGLWSAPDLQGPLPGQRFTIVCKYHVVGAVRSVLVRWALTGSFDAPKQSLPAGYLTDCAFPR